MKTSGFDKKLNPNNRSNGNCELCPTGFTSPGGAEPTCTDIDECEDNNGGCNMTGTQLCRDSTDTIPNTPAVAYGQVLCECKSGYTGTTCSDDVDGRGTHLRRMVLYVLM